MQRMLRPACWCRQTFRETVMLSTILLVIAFVLFAVSAAGISHPRVGLQSAGLACWVASILIGSGFLH